MLMLISVCDSTQLFHAQVLSVCLIIAGASAEDAIEEIPQISGFEIPLINPKETDAAAGWLICVGAVALGYELIVILQRFINFSICNSVIIAFIIAVSFIEKLTLSSFPGLPLQLLPLLIFEAVHVLGFYFHQVKKWESKALEQDANFFSLLSNSFQASHKSVGRLHFSKKYGYIYERNIWQNWEH